jgi:iron-sulfur cluster assembly protein
MLTLSQAASRKIEEVIAQQREHGANVVGLRLSAYPGGCSGHQYGMSLADRTEDGDWVGEFGGVKVVVDRQSLALLEGVSIDYVETPQAQGFTISSPNACACGCGASPAEDATGQADGGCGCCGD